MSKSDDILEQNVSTLIESGGEPPKVDAQARARIKDALVARFAATAPASDAASRAGRPLIAAGFGLAALAAGALIAVGLAGHTPRGTAVQALAVAKLADGTTYVADRGAHVTVLGPRRIRVAGAVLLDVAPGQGTFVVETARGRVEVLGTKFVVDGEPDQTSAAVVRGEVKLASDAGDVTLHAGEQGIAAPGKAPVRGPAPRLSHLVSWAREARHEQDRPVHHGTLFARDPGVRSHPPWGEEYPLPLRQLMLDVVVEDQVARVAMDQTFHNNEAQDLEGVYRFAIPPDAALQRLAMYVGGQLEESAVVERMRARRIYEELVYRRVDPALLEWAGTGRLALRVYPIPAHADKRLVLAYTQSLPKLYDDWTLTIPMPEVDEPVGSLDATVRVKGCANCELESPSHAIAVERSGDDAIVHYHHAAEHLGDSFVLHVRDARHRATVTAKTDGGDRYLMVRSPVELSRAVAPYRPRTWVILDDVSASRGAEELRAQRDLADALVRELDENDRVGVIAFDVEARLKLAPTRVMDVDRRALRASLEHEGGVGATDFQVALAAATIALAGVAPDDAMIVYLGDGMVTSGPRNLDALRAQIAGKAHFIGVGVGDGPDTQTLGELAAATGGYATTFDLSDDLGWRAFDLVAALHTGRVTGLSAQLVDASGATVPATAYLGAPQLADGEELELVAKLAGGGDPAALELTGTQDGAPWHQRIALGAPARTDAGYLPRLWAQRHIAARLLAKHEPVAIPPCTGAMCPSEADLREARDEQIRREVVALGKRYFLLSRHTSLLVLENDAMYAEYGVAKGSGDTWAPYMAPARIAVAHDVGKDTDRGNTTALPADAELVRAPEPSIDDIPERRRALDVDEDRTRVSVSGPLATPTDDEQPIATAAPVAAAVPPTPPAASETSPEQDQGVSHEKFEGNVQSEVMAQGDATGDIVTTPSIDSGYVAVGHGAGMGWFGLGQNGVGGDGGKADDWNKTSYRFRSHKARDFYDLTTFVPALFSGEVDALRATLARSAGTHAIEPAAQALLEQARAALPIGVYRWGDREIAVDGAHQLGWRRTTEDDLTETAGYNGVAWTRRYDELGLAVRRIVAADDVALAFADAPFWIVDPLHYAQFFDVAAKGHDVMMSTTENGHTHVAYVLAFDPQSRLTAIHDGTGRELVTIVWSAAGPIAARASGEPITVGFTPQAIGDASAWAFPGASPAVAVTLPAHPAAYWQTQLGQLAVGTAAWRDAERQLLVSAAAAHDGRLASSTFDALRAHGGVELGDVALASAGLVGLGMSGSFGPAAESRLAAALGPLAQTPLGAYLIGLESAAKAANVAAPGLIGALTQARAALDAVQARRADAALAATAALDGRAIGLKLLVASATAYADSTPALVTALWEACATGRFTNTSRGAAAVQLANAGQYEAAAAQLERVVDSLDLSAPPPTVIAQYRWLFGQTRRGDAGWQLVYARWRDKVLAGDSFAHVMALLPAAAGRQDLDVVLAKAVALAGADPTRELEVARRALAYGQPTWTDRIVQPLLAAAPTSAGATRELYQLAAQSALATGRSADGLADLERAQDAAGDQPATIGEVRAELGTIIGLAQQLALQTTGAARDQLVARAMRWGDRWRAIDPGNIDIDRRLGELLLAVGDQAGAWRQLSSTIERDPWSGTGYTIVAEAFERQGKVEQALPFWQQAIVIDQTNPTPRLRKAQALIALGRTQEGDALLRQITSQKWHDVWSGVVYQAQELGARGGR